LAEAVPSPDRDGGWDPGTPMLTLVRPYRMSKVINPPFLFGLKIRVMY
jgi:hypothetical protein